MASHTGQKWSRFFCSSRDFYGKPYWTKVVEIFLFKSRFFIQVKNSFFNVRVSMFKSRSFLLKLKCFNLSRDFFCSS